MDELSQGVVHFVPPVPPVRRAVAQEDGSLILVRSIQCRCSQKALYSSRCLRGGVAGLQDFPSEESRQDFKLKCIARVEANCMKGAR